MDALVVNRLHPRFGEGSAAEARAAAAADGPAAPFWANLADFRQVAEREESHFAELAGKVAPAPVFRVPFLAADVHDVDGLRRVGEHLFQ